MGDLTGLATAAAQKYGVPSDVFLRLVNAESSGNANTPPSSKGAIGPAQLMPATAKDLGVDPYDTRQNLDGGARYLRQQYDRFGDWTKAVAAYNGGPSRVARAGGVPNITETKNYVGKVMGAPAAQDDNLPSALELLGGQAPAPAHAPAQAPQQTQMSDASPSVADLVPPSASQPTQAPQRAYAPAGQPLNPEAVADVRKLNANVPDWEVPLVQGATYNWAPKLGAEMVKGETWLNNNVAPVFAGHRTGYTPQEAYDAYLADAKARDAAYARAHPAANAALNIAGGFLAPGAKGLGRLGGAGAGAVAGGISGVGSADQGNEGAAGAIGAGTGALVGLVAPALAQQASKGATALARPVVNAVSKWTGGAVPAMALPNFIPQNARQQLVNEGVNLTLGQAFPWLKPVEDIAEKLPFVGGGVKAAQGRAVDSFNSAAVNRVLQPIGETLPSGVHAGNDAVQYAQQRVGQAYDRVLSQIHGVHPDTAFVQDLAKTQSGVPLAPNEQQHLGSIIKWVRGAFQNGSIDGPTLKHLTSEIGGAVSPANSAEFNGRLQALRAALTGAAMRSNPAQAADLMKADQAYTNLVRLQKAAAGASNTGGVFTPQQLGAKVVAADKSSAKRVSAAGNAPMQDLAQAGASVLGKAKPQGGAAAGGHGSGGLLAGLLGGEILEPWLAHHPAAAAGTTGLLGALTLPYTPAGQKVISQMVGKGATNVGQNTRQFVSQNLPALLPYVEGLLPQPQPKAAIRR